MKLCKKREIIFNQRVSSIKAYVYARFNSSQEIDDIVQEALIAYASTLAKCNLNDNYHSYCMTAAKWGALKYITRQKEKSDGIKVSKRPASNEGNSHCDGILDKIDVDSGSINPVVLCTVLENIQAALVKLKPAHKAYIETSYWNKPRHTNTTQIIKERRGRDIKKAFRENVIQRIQDDVIFCESGISSIDNPRIH
jgi:DNA-directed RNA polymerase specialized sigma24 family protein